ncbi:MAG: hypothetical protein AAF483_06330 [Planctomycetota bacterium]
MNTLFQLTIKFALLLIFAGPAQNVWADITIRNFSEATNDRFANDGAFILNGFDLSGVGRVSSPDPGRWATAISRNVLVGASHFFAAGNVEFYANNDPTTPAVTRTITSFVTIPDTDLILYLLNEDLPSSIAHYSFAQETLVGTPGVTTPLPVDSAGVYQDQTAYLFGLSPTTYANSMDVAVGTNKVTGYSENVPTGRPDHDIIILEFDAEGTADAQTHEAQFASGDSGGPAFVEMGGQLRLIGTNAIIYSDGDFVTGGTGSGINYIGNQSAFINNFISSNASVPEPCTSSVVAVLVVSGLMRRRRP